MKKIFYGLLFLLVLLFFVYGQGKRNWDSGIVEWKPKSPYVFRLISVPGRDISDSCDGISRFFWENAERVNGLEFKPIGKILLSDQKTTVSYLQPFVEGVPIYGVYWRRWSDKNGAIRFSGPVLHLRQPEQNGWITDSLTAIWIARQHLSVGKWLYWQGARSYYPNEKGRLTPVWIISVVSADPLADWEVGIDANTGLILWKKNRLRRWERAKGSALLYFPDPVAVARQEYGGLLADHDDQTNPLLDAVRQEVELIMTREQGRYWFRNQWIRIVDLEEPINRFPVSTEEHRFAVSRDSSLFEALMALAHITRAAEWCQYLGYDFPFLHELAVDPAGSYGEDNSHYVPSRNYIAFGTGGVDDAEDAAVIWHEYAHAIQEVMVPHLDGDGETFALLEGDADYFAASYVRSLSDFQWFKLFKWDGHNEFWEGRWANLDWVYPDDFTADHWGGQIWCSALMSLWEKLGREVTDRLFLHSHLYWSSSPVFPEAGNALLEADRELYGGRHLEVITSVLKNYGLYTPPQDILSEGEIYLAEGEPGKAYPNPFHGMTVIPFRLYRQTMVRLWITNMLGQTVRELVKAVYEAGEYRIPWDGRDARGVPVESGIYFYSLQTGDRIKTGKLVLLK